MLIDEFKLRVSRRMLEVHCLDWDDACGDDEPLRSANADGWTPEEFVDWFGLKFDLIPFAQVTARNV